MKIIWEFVDNASAKMGTIFNALNKNIDATEKANTSFKGMAAEVFKGTAAWDLLKKGVGIATDFIKESVTASLEAQATWALVKNNVENAGYSFDEISPKIKAYSASMIEMGFNDEATAESVSRLMLVTNDYDNAIKLNQLALDLSRSKHIELATATTLVTQVTQGNNKVLKQYGIELDDAASSADNLSKLQDKVKGSAEAFANSTAGQMAKVNEQWGEMKEKVGDQLTPILGGLMQIMSDNLPAITELIVGLGGGLAEVLSYIVQISEAWSIWVKGTVDFKPATKILETLNVVADKWNEVHQNAKLTGEEIFNLPWETQKAILEKYGSGATVTADALKKVSTSFAGIGKGSTEAAKAAKDAWDTMIKGTVDSIKKLRDDISSTYNEIQKASLDYIKSEKDTQKSYTEEYVNLVADAQMNIAENRRKQIEALTAGNLTEYESLSQIITEQQKILDTYAKDGMGLTKELDEQKKYLSMNELERLTYDHNKKIEMMRAEYMEEQQARIQKMNDLMTEHNAIIGMLDAQKIAAINAEIEKNKTFKEKLAEQTTYLGTWVKSNVELYKGFVTDANYWLGKLKAPFSMGAMPAGKGNYATGTPYVPETGMYVLHRGEQVVPTVRTEDATPYKKSEGSVVSNVFSFDFSGAFVGDKDVLMREIKDNISRAIKLRGKGI